MEQGQVDIPAAVECLRLFRLSSRFRESACLAPALLRAKPHILMFPFHVCRRPPPRRRPRSCSEATGKERTESNCQREQNVAGPLKGAKWEQGKRCDSLRLSYAEPPLRTPRGKAKPKPRFSHRPARTSVPGGLRENSGEAKARSEALLATEGGSKWCLRKKAITNLSLALKELCPKRSGGLVVAGRESTLHGC